MRRTAVEPQHLPVRTELHGELRGDDHVLPALSFHRAAKQFFVFEWAIHFCGVPKVDADRKRSIEHSDGFRIVAAAIRPRHSHAAETDRRNFQTFTAKLSFFHKSSQIFGSGFTLADAAGLYLMKSRRIR